MTNTPFSITIAGSLGRMGITLMKEVLASPYAELVAGGVRADSRHRITPTLKRHNLAELDMPFSHDSKELVAMGDAIIDFTTPEHSLELAQQAAAQNKIHVCGTTGFTDEQMAALQDFATKTPIIWAPNMAMGVNLVAALTQKVAATLDESFDIEIVEMHHRYKADAPSGTALLLGEAAAKGRDVALEQAAVKTRDGHTGPREEGTIGFATLRGGDVIGDHTVMFAGEGERIELTHKSSSRHIYARGAVKAALWAADKPASFYSMKDVLGI